jgi:hypothetical protein
VRSHPKGPKARSGLRLSARTTITTALLVVLALALGTTLASAVVPAVTVEDATNVGYTTADVEGTVNPEGQGTTYRFQYATQPDFSDAATGIENFTETAEPVSGQLTGLAPGTTYYLRLQAENGDGPSEAIADNTFTTDEVAPPSVSDVAVSEVAYTTAKASGKVEISNGDVAFNTTSCRFEYLTQAQWEENGNAFPAEGAPSKPCDPETVSGPGQTTVEAQLTGLNHGATYHLRLLASNLGGADSEAAADFPTEAVSAPVVTIAAPSAVDADSAHLEGTVDPTGSAGEFDAKWHFEYTTTDFVDCGVIDDLGTGLVLNPNCIQTPSSVVTGAGPQPVEADITGLEPNRTYFVRLVASNLGGETISEAPNPQLTTDALPPLAITDGARYIQPTQAQLNGFVNAHNTPTSYWFEWGTEDCSANPCASIPLGEDGDGSSGNLLLHVEQTLTGIEPSTTYHYRLLAKSAEGTVAGEDVSFETTAPGPTPAPCTNAGMPGADRLPKCRAWEMVSPADKNGGGVAPASTRTRPAADGEAVSYASLSLFGDVAGSSVNGADYVAQRDASGWTTHKITPVQYPPLSAAQESSFYVGEFTPDLSKGIFLGLSPAVSGTFNSDQVPNLYRREDLLAPPPGNFQLLTDSPEPLPARPPFARFGLSFGAASEDLGTVAFDSTYHLTADASGTGVKAYQWREDAPGNGVSLVGVLPDGTPAGSSVIGRRMTDPSDQPVLEADLGRYAVSRDGSRIVFTADPVDGGTDIHGSEGTLYLREDSSQTLPINNSERTDCAGDPSCGGDGEPDPAPDPNGAAPAMFLYGTPDLSKVYFRTGEALVDGDLNNAVDGYVWEPEKPAGERLSLVVPNQPGGPDDVVLSIAATSSDGAYVYFSSRRRDLAPGVPPANEPPASTQNGSKPPLKVLYVSHEGDIRYVGMDSLYVSNETGGEWNDRAEGAGGGRKAIRVSADGRFALFQSKSRTLAESLGLDNDHCRMEHIGETSIITCHELFLYDYKADETVCVSCPAGVAPNEWDLFPGTPFSIENAEGSGTPFFQSSHRIRALLDDGTLFFSSPYRLVPADTNGRYDAYEWDPDTGEHHLLSSGQSRYDSYFMDADADGTDVFFTTRERLVRSDRDDNVDLYDARVGGGIAAQNQAPEAACVEDDCQGLPAAPAGFNQPGSATHSGPGNAHKPRGAKKCAKKKGKARKRCLRKHRKQQRAGSHRGAGK